MNTGKKWYNSVSNWLVIVACIILIPILIMNLSIMLQAKTNKDKVPSIFGFKPFMVLSGSMEHEIHKGDLIITKIIDPDTVEVEDVIAFRDAEGTVTTHRIIDKVEEDGETYFITKGDNNNTQDLNLVGLNDIEGIYVGRIPGIGSMMNSLSEPTTMIILILVITVIFGIGFAISSKKQRELERLEFLEFKRMKEEMEASTKSKTKKTKSIKAEEDEELLEEEKPKRKRTSTVVKGKPKVTVKTTTTRTKASTTTAKPKTATRTKTSVSAKPKTTSTKTKSSTGTTRTRSTASSKTATSKTTRKSTSKKA